MAVIMQKRRVGAVKRDDDYKREEAWAMQVAIRPMKKDKEKRDEQKDDKGGRKRKEN